MTTEGQHLNMNTLSELKEIMQKDYVLLLNTFMHDSVAKLDSIKAAADQGSASELRESAHSFKGSSSNMGAVRLAILSKEIERRAKENRLAGVESLVENLQDEYKIVRQLLQHELRKLH